jgi:hypothetical protein
VHVGAVYRPRRLGERLLLHAGGGKRRKRAYGVQFQVDLGAPRGHRARQRVGDVDEPFGKAGFAVVLVELWRFGAPGAEPHIAHEEEQQGRLGIRSVELDRQVVLRVWQDRHSEGERTSHGDAAVGEGKRAATDHRARPRERVRGLGGRIAEHDVVHERRGGRLLADR